MSWLVESGRSPVAESGIAREFDISALEVGEPKLPEYRKRTP
jgi:hypothetical protein